FSGKHSSTRGDERRVVVCEMASEDSTRDPTLSAWSPSLVAASGAATVALITGRDQAAPLRIVRRSRLGLPWGVSCMDEFSLMIMNRWSLLSGPRAHLTADHCRQRE